MTVISSQMARVRAFDEHCLSGAIRVVVVQRLVLLTNYSRLHPARLRWFMFCRCPPLNGGGGCAGGGEGSSAGASFGASSEAAAQSGPQSSSVLCCAYLGTRHVESCLYMPQSAVSTPSTLSLSSCQYSASVMSGVVSFLKRLAPSTFSCSDCRFSIGHRLRDFVWL